jgi:hypothetical protein
MVGVCLERGDGVYIYFVCTQNGIQKGTFAKKEKSEIEREREGMRGGR